MTVPALLLLATALTAGAPSPVLPPVSPPVLQADAIARLLDQDLRLATVAHPLLTANDRLCLQHMPMAGIELQSSDQYPDPEATGLFGTATVAVAAVLPGSAGGAAGILPGDGVRAIDGQAVADLAPDPGAPLRDTAFRHLAAGDPGGVRLSLDRGGQVREVVLAAPSGCRVLVEQRVDDHLGARSNGLVIQVNSALTALVDDDALAVILAHELAHVVLDHRRRLQAQGVAKGFFGEFGRNQRLNRQMEVEADRLSVHLLANAGRDPHAAPQFWRSALGRRIGGGLLHSAVYPSAEGRARLLEREIADYLPRGEGPSWPGHLLARRADPD